MSLSALNSLLNVDNPIVEHINQTQKTMVYCNGLPLYGSMVFNHNENKWESQKPWQIANNFLDKFTAILFTGKTTRLFQNANPDLHTYEKVYVRTVATKYGSQQKPDALNRNRTEFAKKGFGHNDTYLRSRGVESKQVLLALHEVESIDQVESIEGVVNGKTVRILGTFGDVRIDNDLIGRGISGVSPKRISLGIVGDISVNLSHNGVNHNLHINRSGQVFYDNTLIANIEAIPSPKGKWENITSSNFAQFLNKYAPRQSFGTFTLDKSASKTKEAINAYDQECIARYGKKMPLVIDGDRAMIGRNTVAKFVTYGDSVSLRWYLTHQGKNLGNLAQIKIAIRNVFDTYSNQIENKQANNASRKLTKLCKDFIKLGERIGLSDKFTTITYEKIIALHGLNTVKVAIVEDLRDQRNGIVPSRTKGLL